MSLTDDQFRDAFKPLHIPAVYHAGDSQRDKVLFALGQLGEGTAEEVASKLRSFERSADHKQLLIALCTNELTELFDQGLLNGIQVDGEMRYNLHKITEANNGAVNPDLLAPGLD